jgi:hypothetical protein
MANAPTSPFSQIRKIDNTGNRTPFSTILAIAFIIIVVVWFARGESFRLYASLFFGLYHLTKLSWLSIILVSVIQNIFFLPFRFLSERFYIDLKEFENEISKMKSDDQYFVLKSKVREGNLSVIFYIINFLLIFIAFISAGRVFFLEFYHTPIAKHWLYNFIPYPEYPLQGVIFHFPFFKVTQTMSLNWSTIFWIWAVPVLVLVVLRLLWRIIKPLLSGNTKLLQVRIRINHLKIIFGGFVGTLLILSTYFFRHLPTGVQFIYLSADLSKQNTVFNIITALCSCLATIYSGYQHSSEAAREARKKGIPEDIIAKVTKQTMRTSMHNGLLLGVSALWVTRLMPCSHDLSVLAFLGIYVTSPLTFDLIVPKSKHRA